MYLFTVKQSPQKEVNEMVRVLDLEAKRHKFSSTLSGGQKRKLSVGIALIAGSKVIH
jgi:ATP-binding cassette subfamily A (ABC1) protein 3